jgi:hypothetical protein
MLVDAPPAARVRSGKRHMADNGFGCRSKGQGIEMAWTIIEKLRRDQGTAPNLRDYDQARRTAATGQSVGIVDHGNPVPNLRDYDQARRTAATGQSVGIVDHGNPVPTNRIATDLGRSRETTLTNLDKLEAGNYIERSAAVGHAYDYRVKILLK